MYKARVVLGLGLVLFTSTTYGEDRLPNVPLGASTATLMELCTSTKLEEQAFCTGYLHGAMEAYEALSVGSLNKKVCIPESRQRVDSPLLSFDFTLKTDPELFQYHRIVALFDMFSREFPCNKIND